MSSVGQVVGGVVGGIIGFFAGGNVMLGASIGMAIGGYIDPPKGPKIEGPRLNDLSVQSATYGARIPRVYGTIATFGNVFWVENNQLKETKKTESQGGKGGGGGAETTTYKYSATFALGLCLGPIDGIRRIWCAGKLIYDAGSTNLSTVAASEIGKTGMAIGAVPSIGAMGVDNASLSMSVYLGTDDQLPDPRMQAALGVANTPAYRGLAYIVFNDFDLTDYGNSLMGAQMKVEVIKDGTWSGAGAFAARVDFADLPVQTNYTYTVRYDSERFYVSYLVFDDTYSDLVGVGQKTGVITCPVFPGGAITVVPPYNPDAWYGNSFVNVIQSDEDIVIFVRGRVLPAVTNRVIAYSAQGELVCDTGEFSATQFPNGATQFIIDRGEIFAISWSGFVFKCAKTVQPSPPIFSISPDTFSCRMFGVSENYVFLVIADGNTTTTTVKKLNRGDLSVAETITFSADSRYVSISVVSDSLFYQMSGLGTTLGKWEDGAYSITSLTYTGPIEHGTVSYIRFFVFSDRFAVFFAKQTTTYVDVYTATLAIAGNGAQLADIIEAECTSSGVLITSDIDVSLIDETVIGYKVTETAAIRASLLPLQSAWPFDAIMDGYKIKFVQRGLASVATITEDELAAVAGGEKPAVRITNSREMDLQLPRRVNATYLDINREYDVGTGPGAERLNTDAVNIQQIEMPIVMNATQAAGIEEVLLYLYWIERNEVRMVLPPSRAALQPTDVVTVQTSGATYELRLTEINYLPDGRIECVARMNNAAIYSPAAVGEEGAYSGQELVYAGPTELILLDIPRIIDTQDGMGIPFGMWGYASGWRAGVLMRSDDIGATWNAVSASNQIARVFKMTGTALPDASPYSVDRTAFLTVTALVSSSELVSITETQLYAHGNLAAIGADGRWEIIAFQTATDLGSDQYKISNLLRGLYGTEGNTGNHTATDLLIMLDTDRLAYCGMPVDSIGVSRLFRAVTENHSIDSAPDITQSYLANNFKPLAPVDLRSSSTPSSGDWLLAWTRRTRTPVEVFSGLSVPLAESSEAYEVDVLSTDWSTVKRTLTGLSSPAAQITLAQQIADFGEEQTAINLDVYQMSSTVGRGHRYRVIARRPGWEAQYAQYISSGMHFNGTAGSQVFTDTVPSRSWSAFGNAQIVADAAAFGGFSASFDGTGDYVINYDTLAFTPGINEDFTVCGWVTPASVTTVRGIVSTRWTSGQVLGWNLYHDSTAKVVFWFTDNLSNSYWVDNPASLSNGVRAYVALCKKGSTYRLYVNGVGGTPYTYNAAIFDVAGSTTRYGRFSPNHTSYDFSGKLDDWRIYRGFCLYERDFVPPAFAFVDR